MTKKIHEIIKARQVDHGVSLYDRDSVEGVEVGGERDALLGGVETAIDIFNVNHKKRDGFNFHPKNKYPKRGPLELVIPTAFDPHEATLQLAKLSIGGWGFGFVASLDVNKYLASEEAAERGMQQLRDYDQTDSFGMAFIVQSVESTRNPNTTELRDHVGKLTVPTMYVMYLPRPEGAPSPIVADAASTPESRDLASGADLIS